VTSVATRPATEAAGADGVLNRSPELDNDDLVMFGRLGFCTVFDLRTAGERRAQPDHLADEVQPIVCDVLTDSQDTAPAQLAGVLSDPARAAELLGAGKAVTLADRAYSQIVSLPSALAPTGGCLAKSSTTPASRRSFIARRARAAPAGRRRPR
jgi:hypothetical protein